MTTSPLPWKVDDRPEFRRAIRDANNVWIASIIRGSSKDRIAQLRSAIVRAVNSDSKIEGFNNSWTCDYEAHCYWAFLKDSHDEFCIHFQGNSNITKSVAIANRNLVKLYLTGGKQGVVS